MRYFCKQCGGEFHDCPAAKRIYCNRNCWRLAQIGNQYAKGSVRSPEMRRKVAMANLGNRHAVGIKNGNYRRGRFSKITRICLVCGKGFKTEQYQLDKNCGKYCSRKCYGETLKRKLAGSRNHAWRGGTSFEPYTPEFNERLKARIRGRDEFVCQVCGKPNSRFVHHINYDKKDSRNCNLITLCNSCHGKTNFQRGFWTGVLFMQTLFREEFWTRKP